MDAPMTTVDAVLDLFRAADRAVIRPCLIEAEIIAGARYRWQHGNRLGVVVGDIGIRDARDQDYAELEEAIALGQVQIVRRRYFLGKLCSHEVLFKATGFPLDPNSEAARRQRARWARADQLKLAAVAR